MGWIIFILIILLCLVIISYDSEIKELKKHTPENEKLLTEKLKQDIKLADRTLNDKFRKGELVLKLPRKLLVNTIRTFNDDYVYLSINDNIFLKIEDTYTQSKIQVDIENRKS